MLPWQQEVFEALQAVGELVARRPTMGESRLPWRGWEIDVLARQWSADACAYEERREIANVLEAAAQVARHRGAVGRWRDWEFDDLARQVRGYCPQTPEALAETHDAVLDRMIRLGVDRA